MGMAQLCVLCKQRQKGCCHPVSLNGHILPGYSLARLNTAGPGCFRAVLCTQEWTVVPVELSWGQPHTSQPHTCQPHLFHLCCSHRLRQSQTISQHNQSFFLFYNSRLCRAFCTL